MTYHGIAPFLECSSAGDKRFSAYFARIKGRGNQSIEAIYQAAKLFSCGSTGLSIKEARGKRPVNIRECSALYGVLWDEYMAENPDLLAVIREASGLCDRFGQRGHACQATELWRIRNTSQTETFV